MQFVSHQGVKYEYFKLSTVEFNVQVTSTKGAFFVVLKNKYSGTNHWGWLSERESTRKVSSTTADGEFPILIEVLSENPQLSRTAGEGARRSWVQQLS